MRFLLMIVCSILSGIFAGMGMGGGTVLIPMLSIFFGVSQILCQSTNVICFIVLAVICMIIYIKKGLVKFNMVLCVSLPAMAVALFASFFAVRIKSQILEILFSSFIILIGIIMFIQSIKKFLLKK